MPDEKEIRSLPAPESNGRGASVPAIPEHITVYPSYCLMPSRSPKTPPLPLAHYLWILRRHQWKIMAFVVRLRRRGCNRVLAAHTDIRIDRHDGHRPQVPTGIIGQDATRDGTATTPTSFWPPGQG